MRFRNQEKIDDLSDLELLDLYKTKGNLEVLSTLYNRYIHLVFGLCLKYLKNKQDSEDAVMQIFEKLILEVPKFEIKNFKSWLHVLSKNYCLMQIRRFKSKVEFNEAFSASMVMENETFMHHDDESSLDENLRAMKECMKLLQDNQRKCVELFYLNEMSYKEIVRQEGLNLNEVKSFIQNGKRNIKNCIEKKIE